MMKKTEKIKNINTLKEVKNSISEKIDSQRTPYISLFPKKKTVLKSLASGNSGRKSFKKITDAWKIQSNVNDQQSSKYSRKNVSLNPFAVQQTNKNLYEVSIKNMPKLEAEFNNLNNPYSSKKKAIESRLSKAVKSVVEEAGYKVSKLDEIIDNFKFFMEESKEILDGFAEVKEIMEDFEDTTNTNEMTLRKVEINVKNIEIKHDLQNIPPN